MLSHLQVPVPLGINLASRIWLCSTLYSTTTIPFPHVTSGISRSIDPSPPVQASSPADPCRFPGRVGGRGAEPLGKTNFLARATTHRTEGGKGKPRRGNGGESISKGGRQREASARKEGGLVISILLEVISANARERERRRK